MAIILTERKHRSLALNSTKKEKRHSITYPLNLQRIFAQSIHECRISRCNTSSTEGC